jgi:hypothetical protein
MYKVLAAYSGTIVMLMQTDYKAEAENFMKYPYTILYADETDYTNEDEIIYPNEMWLTEEDIPFEDAPSPQEVKGLEEMPF